MGDIILLLRMLIQLDFPYRQGRVGMIVILMVLNPCLAIRTLSGYPAHIRANRRERGSRETDSKTEDRCEDLDCPPAGIVME